MVSVKCESIVRYAKNVVNIDLDKITLVLFRSWSFERLCPTLLSGYASWQEKFIRKSPTLDVYMKDYVSFSYATI